MSNRDQKQSTGASALSRSNRPAGSRRQTNSNNSVQGSTHDLQVRALVSLQSKVSKGVRSTLSGSPCVLEAEAPSGTSRDEGFLRYLRESPMYKQPFIGCKVANVQLGSTAVSWSGTTWNLATTITQGVADNQRTGDVIRLIGVDLRMRVSKGTAVAPGSDSEYQLALCYSPLATISIGMVFQDTGTAYSGLSAADWDYSAALKRLAHKMGSVDTYHALRTHSMKVRCNELINYDGGTTTVSTGSLIVAAITGEDPAAPTQVPAVYGNCQFYYQDV